MMMTSLMISSLLFHDYLHWVSVKFCSLRRVTMRFFSNGFCFSMKNELIASFIGLEGRRLPWTTGPDRWPPSRCARTWNEGNRRNIGLNIDETSNGSGNGTFPRFPPKDIWIHCASIDARQSIRRYNRYEWESITLRFEPRHVSTVSISTRHRWPLRRLKHFHYASLILDNRYLDIIDINDDSHLIHGYLDETNGQEWKWQWKTWKR